MPKKYEIKKIIYASSLKEALRKESKASIEYIGQIEEEDEEEDDQFENGKIYGYRR